MRREADRVGRLFFGLLAILSVSTSASATPFLGNPPLADAGGPYSADESSAVGTVWNLDFDATRSIDDHGIFLYEWDWDYDGTFVASGDTSPTPSHSWSTPGLFDIALRVWDDDDGDGVADQPDIDLTTVSVQANAPPIADAGGPYEATALAGVWSIDFDATGSTDDFGIFLYEWDWDLDGVFDASGPTPAHSWFAPGAHTVDLRVTDNAGQTDHDTAQVQLVPEPTTLVLVGLGLAGLGYRRRWVATSC